MSVTTTLTIDGMTCGNCERHVRTALLGLPGVTEATADHEAANATVVSADALDLAAVASVLEEEGYTLK